MAGRYYKRELEILKEKFETTEKEELLRLLPGREWIAILAKAKRMGLNRKKFSST